MQRKTINFQFYEKINVYQAISKNKFVFCIDIKYVFKKTHKACSYQIIKENKKHLKNVGPIRHNEQPHTHSTDVASGTVARRLRIDVHDIDNDDNDNDNDNA